MNTTYKVLIGVVVGVILATGVGYLIARNTITSSSLGGVVGVGEVQTNTFWFVNGLFAGTSQQFAVSKTGAISVNGGTVIDSSGIITAVVGGSLHSTYALSTSTTLTGAFDCQYDTVQETTSTAAITLTLPSATSTAASCLTQDGTWETLFINLAPGNNFNVTIATSTGDVLAYNATSTAGGAVLSTSTTGSYYTLNAIRYSSTSVAYQLTNNGVAH
jgi:hypothetical protein